MSLIISDGMEVLSPFICENFEMIPVFKFNLFSPPVWVPIQSEFSNESNNNDFTLL